MVAKQEEPGITYRQHRNHVQYIVSFELLIWAAFDCFNIVFPSSLTIWNLETISIVKIGMRQTNEKMICKNK